MPSIRETAKKRKEAIASAMSSGSRGPFMPHTEIRVRIPASETQRANEARQVEEATGLHRRGMFTDVPAATKHPVIRRRKRG